jgi:hypothetical protein
VVDAHAERHDQLDVLERRQQAAVRLPGQGDPDIVGVSEVVERAVVDGTQRVFENLLPVQAVGIAADVSDGV